MVMVEMMVMMVLRIPLRLLIIVVVMMMVVMVVVITAAVSPILRQLNPRLRFLVRRPLTRGRIGRFERLCGIRNGLHEFSISVRARCRLHGNRCMSRSQRRHRQNAGQSGSFLVHFPPMSAEATESPTHIALRRTR